jgi:hypothetical protein
VLRQHNRTKPLDGLGYQPIAVAGTKGEFLEWIGAAVKEKVIEIPDENDSIRWNPHKRRDLSDRTHRPGDFWTTDTADSEQRSQIRCWPSSDAVAEVDEAISGGT